MLNSVSIVRPVRGMDSEWCPRGESPYWLLDVLKEPGHSIFTAVFGLSSWAFETCCLGCGERAPISPVIGDPRPRE